MRAMVAVDGRLHRATVQMTAELQGRPGELTKPRGTEINRNFQLGFRARQADNSCTMTTTTSKPSCKYLILDAGPLLSLSPLRGLAEQFITVPQVLSELKDSKARQHFEQLGLSIGVAIDVKVPDPGCLAEGTSRVIKKVKHEYL